jgi:hypothetical protein
LGDEDHKWQLVARVLALLETVESNSSERIRPCEIQKLINSLKLEKACGIDSMSI